MILARAATKAVLRCFADRPFPKIRLMLICNVQIKALAVQTRYPVPVFGEESQRRLPRHPRDGSSSFPGCHLICRDGLHWVILMPPKSLDGTRKQNPMIVAASTKTVVSRRGVPMPRAIPTVEATHASNRAAMQRTKLRVLELTERRITASSPGWPHSCTPAIITEGPAKSRFRCVSSLKLAYSVGGRPTRARVRTL